MSRTHHEAELDAELTDETRGRRLIELIDRFTDGVDDGCYQFSESTIDLLCDSLDRLRDALTEHGEIEMDLGSADSSN